ncbi:MAG: InlB B-repeat-containing protein, partial [Lachnospiraceae bacterium]|nr:InlB B-repeat-containing protein [Lachnospiraceae bacterium]
YGVFFYDENKTYLGKRLWLTEANYDIPDGARYVRIVMKYSNDRTITDTELSELNGCIVVSDKPSNLFTVTYDANDGYFLDGNGQSMGEEYLVYADAGLYWIWAPEPVREGYTFMGWTDTRGRFLSSTTLRADTTFIAEWEQSITITYNANGGEFGSGEGIETVNVEAGVWYANNYETPVRTGYEFVGWKLNGRFKNKISVTGPITLVADWEPVIAVTYNANGGGWHYGEDTLTTQVTYEPEGIYYIGWEIPERDGYIFGGWTVAGINERSVRLTAPITVMATWYQFRIVTYDANGGSFDGWDEENGETDSIHYRESPSVDFYFDGWIPSRDGYEFGGWSFSRNGEAVEDPLNLTQDTTFYAVWIALPVVTYDANGGGWYWDGQNYDHITETEEMYFGNYHVCRGWPDRDGYEFVGWSESSTATEALSEWDTILTGPITYYAIWKKLPILTFDAGLGHFWEGETAKAFYEDPDRLVYLGGYCDEPSRDGYRFDGWTIDGEVVTRIRMTEDITVEAEWVKVYTVIYDANGGVFPNGEAAAYDYPEAGVYWFGYDTPARGGYEFAGWTDDLEDLSGISAVRITENTEDITVYALWDEIQESYTVTYDAGEGIFSNGQNTATIETAGMINVGSSIEEPTRDGYRLNGWKLVGDVEDRIWLTYRVEENVSFYAVWVPTATMTYDFAGGEIGMEVDGVYQLYATSMTHTPDVGSNYTIGVMGPLHKDGYELAGWEDNNGQMHYNYNDTIEVVGDMNFTAVWIESGTGVYTVTYHMPVASGSDIPVASGSDIQVPVGADETHNVGDDGQGGQIPIPVRENYTFLGWNYDGDPNSGILSSIVVTENVNLYPVWQYNGYQCGLCGGLDGNHLEDCLNNPDNVTTGVYDTTTRPQECLAQVNALRASLSLNSLTWDDDLAEIARIRAQQIVSLFTHDQFQPVMNAELGDSITDYYPIGENILYCMPADYYSGSDMYQMWHDSPGHYANMVYEGFTRIGIAAFIYNGYLYGVQIFGGQ